jgi:16S rRNA processing protein RimM
MTAGPTAGEIWTVLARIIRPQGRRGEVLAEVLTDFPERFADRRRLFLISSESSAAFVREAALESYWLHKGRIVLQFARINSISDADTLRGLLVAIPASERAALTDDSVYIGDLIGCEIIDITDGAATIGAVTDVDREAGLLDVTTPGGEELLIPFAKAYLVKMDLAARRIEMRLPAGLLDINIPTTDEERRELDASGKDE